MFHKSVIDWNTDKRRSREFHTNIKEAHNSFANKLLLQLDKNNNSNIEWKFPEEKHSYLINHFLDHLDGADRQEWCCRG